MDGSMALVVDASIALGWFIRTQASLLTAAALKAITIESGHVPPYFAIEVARALRNQERRSLLSPETVGLALAKLAELPLREDSARSLDTVLEMTKLARRYGLRIADAAYLELALRSGDPLATRDSQLDLAAQAAGVPLFTG